MEVMVGLKLTQHCSTMRSALQKEKSGNSVENKLGGANRDRQGVIAIVQVRNNEVLGKERSGQILKTSLV